MIDASPAKAQPRLVWRDAVPDWAHVESKLCFTGTDRRQPVATIAITTYNRPDLLVEAVRSALAQDFSRPVEVAVFDNEPTSRGWEALVAAVPELEHANFCYWVNGENFGIFGNFNRCLELARGDWLAILSDDDLLDPNYLSTMFAELEARSGVDGIVCHKRSLDQRVDNREPDPSTLRRSAQRALFAAKFGRQVSRRIDGAKLFWWPGGVVGTPSGFLFRRQAALDDGGFYAEEDMAADYWFYSRFASRRHLRQHRATAATVRIAVNESAKPSTLRGFLVEMRKVQLALLAGAMVPAWWSRFSPLILARQRAYIRDFWNVDLPEAEVEALLGVRLPRDRPAVYKALRLIFGGY